MNQQIYLDGELVTGTVYMDRDYRKPVKFPVEGMLGYVVRGHKEVTLVFSSKFGVWHSADIDISKHSDRIRSKRSW